MKVIVKLKRSREDSKKTKGGKDLPPWLRK